MRETVRATAMNGTARYDTDVIVLSWCYHGVIMVLSWCHHGVIMARVVSLLKGKKRRAWESMEKELQSQTHANKLDV
jgi:hypothetical protein